MEYGGLRLSTRNNEKSAWERQQTSGASGGRPRETPWTGQSSPGQAQPRGSGGPRAERSGPWPADGRGLTRTGRAQKPAAAYAAAASQELARGRDGSAGSRGRASLRPQAAASRAPEPASRALGGGSPSQPHPGAHGPRPLQLTQVPDELSILTELEILDISYNSIKELPKNIGELSKLVHFNASNNLISVLPLSFGFLNKLKHLNMSGNHLTELPNGLNNLSSLREINFDENPLIKPPHEVCKGKVLNIIGHYLQKAEDRDEKILQKLFRIVSQALPKIHFEFFCQKLQLKKPVIDILVKKTNTRLEEGILEALNIWRVEKDPPLTPAALRDHLIRIITVTGLQELGDKVKALKLSTQLFKL
ncbi:leucine-rich repeat and death domain-containing protein 1 isoform X5 [Macrotis lagotis]|uniref:leucine-rich repeat and death domain-containing protein 1 isoform X5 n=1 Tax=Macrotis lagotis TaxID=92651 RepID=UPI003D698C43